MTLEDETGNTNLVIRPQFLEQHRHRVLRGQLLVVDGVLENRDGVQHLLVEALQDHSALLGELQIRSRDFH